MSSFDRDDENPPDAAIRGAERAPLRPDLPTDLPPVEPPSAGLIVQLFLIPALIVAVIVGVYALFGRLATQEQDWRQLVVDVRSENPFVRWKGALGLAQLLDADSARSSSGERLRDNPEIAKALADLYRRLIQQGSPDESELKEIEFLSKALGRMTAVEEIVPVLREGMQPERDREIRKHSLIGVAMLAGTMGDAGRPLDSPDLVQDVIAVSQESEPLFRHQAAFILGLLPSDQGKLRLEGLLEDADPMTRLNAAIAFTRSGGTEGLPVLRAVVDDAAAWQLDPAQVRTTDEGAQYLERRSMVTNAIRGLKALAPGLPPEQQTVVVQELIRFRDSSRDMELNSSVIELLDALDRK